MRRSVCWLALFAAALLLAPAAAQGDLNAGAGRSDVTPPTGYPLLGWARGDARATGQHTRLFARAIVLQQGDQKLALVAVDANSVPGGMVKHAIDRVRRRGFDETNVVVGASHTHAGPTGFSNYLFKDAAGGTPRAPESGVTQPDPQLYTFMVERVALAIERADRDLAPATGAWGVGEIANVTRNRSLEAHLANHGIREPRGSGRVEQDLEGPAHTIDPSVDVLRVDRIGRGGRRTALATWSNFANHGTVYKSTFPYYNADHHGAADRVIEDELRRAGAADPVNVYANGAAGDVSAGLDNTGPADAEEVGRREARVMLAAWRSAGGVLTRDLPIATRWTRVCFCGQQTPHGRLDDHAVFGQSYLTGSEEGRGPLFELNGEIFEGRRTEEVSDPQGNKVPARRDDDLSLEPPVVPLSAVRIGDRVMLAVPAEVTAELGRRMKTAALRATPGPGSGIINRAVLAGYSNEYVSYLTTPEEYAEQHYEGGVTVYGPASGLFISDALAELTGALASGRPAPGAVDFDPTRGLRPDARPYPDGAARGRITRQPRAIDRLDRAAFSWQGGASGMDMPLDRPFVRIERRAGRRWMATDDDLGLRILWSVDDGRSQTDGPPEFPAAARGTYTAQWEAPLNAPTGTYRFVVTARRYELTSRPFRLRVARDLIVSVADNGDRRIARLAYPPAAENRDITWRPVFAARGSVVARIEGRRVRVPIRGGAAVLSAEPGDSVALIADQARDAHGNRSSPAGPG